MKCPFFKDFLDIHPCHYIGGANKKPSKNTDWDDFLKTNTVVSANIYYCISYGENGECLCDRYKDKTDIKNFSSNDRLFCLFTQVKCKNIWFELWNGDNGEIESNLVIK